MYMTFGFVAIATGLAGAAAAGLTDKLGGSRRVKKVSRNTGACCGALGIGLTIYGFFFAAPETDKVAEERQIETIATIEKTRTGLSNQSAQIITQNDKIIALLKENRGGAALFSDALLQALAERTDRSLTPQEQLSDLITRFDAAQELINQGEHPSNLNDFVQAVQKRVADKLRAGDLDGADKEAGDAFDQWQREEADRAQAAKQGGLAILDTGIDTALARGDAAAAAQREWQKIQLEHTEAEWTGALWARQGHYREEGERTGARLDLQVSLALCEIGLNTAPTVEDGAGHHNHKAIALSIMGARAGGEDGLTYLRQAIDAYDKALTVRTFETMPADWAMTQQNKAGALQVMGQRAGGEDGLTYLRQAIDAYDKALTVRTRETMPALWAMTRENMAILFLTRFEIVEDITDLDLAQTAAEDAMSIYSQGGMEYDVGTCQTLLNDITALKAQHTP